MHPAVQISRLQCLPPSIRRFASPACARNSTLKEVERAMEYIQEHRAELSNSQHNAFLPVFFHHLDPAKIPSPGSLDSMDVRTSETISCALISLAAIAHMHQLPRAVGVSLWPRVWPWTHFIITHRDRLPAPPPQPTFETDFVRLIGQFHDHPDGWELISSTPGFRCFVAQIWKIGPVIQEPYRELMFSDLSGFIADLGVREPKNLDEFVQGAGGDVKDLAALIVQYMRSIPLKSPSSRIVPGGLATEVFRLFTFIVEADQHPGDDVKWLGTPFGPFFEALVRAHGAIETVLELMHTLIGSYAPHTDSAKALKIGLSFITRLLISPWGYASLEPALEAGILKVIVSCATLSCSSMVYLSSRYLLRVGIPLGLVRRSFYELEDATATAEFRHSKIFEDWEIFVKLARGRIEILDDEQFEEPWKACDNLKCGNFDAKQEFKRCSRCKSFYYCSSECQKTDWQSGGHRTACKSYGNLIMHESMPGSSLGTRERDYLRSLLRHDYIANIEKICAEQIKAMSANRSAVLLTVFDYCFFDLQLEVHSATDSALAADLRERSEAEYNNLVARSKASEGTLQLHVIRIMVASVRRDFVIPLRTADSEMYDTMKKLAAQGSYDADGEEFLGLLEVAVDTTIHS
ncbi:hypothetical protein R3P38DRAFT_2985551 [Favolaschia claudopus]|uniref:phytol kinase n=1 Tax=Favolaschia claudopus TaxID=2862362 RepID=A0AAW0AX99_9AGAR